MLGVVEEEEEEEEDDDDDDGSCGFTCLLVGEIGGEGFFGGGDLLCM